VTVSARRPLLYVGASGERVMPMVNVPAVRGSRFAVLGVAAPLAALGLGVGLAAPARAQQPVELPPAEVEKADRLRRDLRQMIALARDRVFPALVNIQVITVRYWGGKEQKGRAIGSGTIISPDGYVLTNYHVAQNGRKFKVTLADKQEVTADLVGEDPLTDLALLKINRGELKDSGTALPCARFGDSDELEVGDTVMAMGSPWALSRSVTLGIVSNTERILATSDDELEELRFDSDQRTGIFNRWIQHDAAINPGNSGGPLVNLKGELIGINTRGMILGGDMGFAIPANIARVVADALIRDGQVPRSAYGLSLKSIKNSGYDRGVLVNSVEKDGPADAAGIRAGDLIAAIEGEPVTIRFPEEIPPLLKRLADKPIGTTVSFTHLRGGHEAEARVVTVRMERDKGDEAAFRGWGLTAMGITEKMARERRLDSRLGVLVSSVRSGSSAALAEPPIQPGDVIRRIDDQEVPDLEAFAQRYEAIMAQEKLPDYLLVEFDRGGKSHITLLKPKPDKDQDPPREVAKAWIGVATQPVVEKLARQLGHPELVGFRVTRVYPGTLAAESGLKVGDLIVELDGEKLRPRGMEDVGSFHRAVRRLDIDSAAALKLLRDGELIPLSVKLERTRLTPEEALRDRNRDFELTVRELTFFDRDENRWDESVAGVLVVEVESAGWAGLGGVRPGDLIQRIGEFDIDSLAGYRTAIEAITKAQPERVVFVVLRGVRTHFQYVEPDWGPVLERNETAEAAP
jgi:serine protease Do